MNTKKKLTQQNEYKQHPTDNEKQKQQTVQ